MCLPTLFLELYLIHGGSTQVSVRLNACVHCNTISYMSSRGKNLFSIQRLCPVRAPHQDKKEALEYMYIVLFSLATNHSLCKIFVYLKLIFSLSPIKHCSFYFQYYRVLHDSGKTFRTSSAVRGHTKEMSSPFLSRELFGSQNLGQIFFPKHSTQAALWIWGICLSFSLEFRELWNK